MPISPAADGQMHCGQLDIRIDTDGVWFYNGSKICRPDMLSLFASVLCRDEGGAFWLVTPTELGRITVEDAPFIGVELYPSGTGPEQCLSLRTNMDEIVPIDAEHPLVMRDHLPYVMIREGIEARINRASYYDLVDRATSNASGMLGVWSAGVFFPLS